MIDDGNAAAVWICVPVPLQVCIKVTIINFTMTKTCLEDQLLKYINSHTWKTKISHPSQTTYYTLTIHCISLSHHFPSLFLSRWCLYLIYFLPWPSCLRSSSPQWCGAPGESTSWGAEKRADCAHQCWSRTAKIYWRSYPEANFHLWGEYTW